MRAEIDRLTLRWPLGARCRWGADRGRSHQGQSCESDKGWYRTFHAISQDECWQLGILHRFGPSKQPTHAGSLVLGLQGRLTTRRPGPRDAGLQPERDRRALQRISRHITFHSSWVKAQMPVPLHRQHSGNDAYEETCLDTTEPRIASEDPTTLAVPRASL